MPPCCLKEICGKAIFSRNLFTCPPRGLPFLVRQNSSLVWGGMDPSAPIIISGRTMDLPNISGKDPGPSVLLYFHVERTTAENSYEPDLEAGEPFFGSRHPPFMPGGGTPPICTKVTPPTPGQQEGGGGIMLLKNRSGGGGTSHFWERGVPPCRKRGPYPH